MFIFIGAYYDGGLSKISLFPIELCPILRDKFIFMDLTHLFMCFLRFLTSFWAMS